MNILLVSDDEVYAKSLTSKLVFLREQDVVTISSYSCALQNLNNTKVVLVHQNPSSENTIKLIKDLRCNENLCIILVAKSDSELILSAYDAGIDDFISDTAFDFEFVVRIVNNIKHNSFKNSVKRNEKVLEHLGVINEETGIYNYNIRILDEYFASVKGVMLALKPKRCTKTFLKKFSEIIKSVLRSPDFVMHGRNNVFYIILPDTNIDGAVVVFDKLKTYFDEKIRIFAGMTQIYLNNIERTENKVLELLAQACSENMEYAVEAKDIENSDDWLEDTKPHNYKLFKQIFHKKLDKVIVPVFFRLQKAYEEKLYRVKIEQFVDEEECVFKLKSKKQNSMLKIAYPGYAKLLIQIIHEGLDSPENEEFILPLTKLSQKDLAGILETFILNYKAYIGEKNA